MYHYAHDPKEHLFVARLAGGGDQQADFDLHLEHLRPAIEAATAAGTRLKLVILFEHEHEVPNAVMRAKVAEFQRQPWFNPQVVLVSRNPLMRGVLTALEWLRGGRMSMLTAASPEQATAELERFVHQKLPRLPGMIAKLCAR